MHCKGAAHQRSLTTNPQGRSRFLFNGPPHTEDDPLSRLCFCFVRMYWCVCCVRVRVCVRVCVKLVSKCLIQSTSFVRPMSGCILICAFCLVLNNDHRRKKRQ